MPGFMYAFPSDLDKVYDIDRRDLVTREQIDAFLTAKVPTLSHITGLKYSVNTADINDTYCWVLDTDSATEPATRDPTSLTWTEFDWVIGGGKFFIGYDPDKPPTPVTVKRSDFMTGMTLRLKTIFGRWEVSLPAIPFHLPGYFQFTGSVWERQVSDRYNPVIDMCKRYWDREILLQPTRQKIAALTQRIREAHARYKKLDPESDEAQKFGMDLQKMVDENNEASQHFIDTAIPVIDKTADAAIVIGLNYCLGQPEINILRILNDEAVSEIVDTCVLNESAIAEQAALKKAKEESQPTT